MFDYHFQAKKGWINDPNGLAFYKGKYHLFFQHNPHDVVWDTMHWGHAVSNDLLKWEEMPIAMYPDQPYENGMGCFSGCGFIKDDQYQIFYTAVDQDKHQTQCRGFYEGEPQIRKDNANPVIISCPDGDPLEFRDPKVSLIDGTYYMVLGTGKDHEGRIVLYRSEDLEAWEYVGILFRGTEFGDVIECPDLFRLGDTFVLSFSYFAGPLFQTVMYTGDFDGRVFTPHERFQIENSEHFYAPQTMEKDGHRIMIGWLRDIYKEGAVNAGAMSIPREITYQDGRLFSFPVESARALLKDRDEAFTVKEDALYKGDQLIYQGKIRHVDFLRDHELVEVFINGGEVNMEFYPV